MDPAVKAAINKSLEGVDPKELDNVLSQMFVRMVKPPTDKKEKKKDEHQISEDIVENLLTGTITSAEGIDWVVLGMRTLRFTPNNATEYDVYRKPRSYDVDGVKFEERMPHEKRSAIMRLCRYNSPKDHNNFRNELDMLTYIRQNLNHKRHLEAFPAVLDKGLLKTLTNLNVSSNRELGRYVAIKPKVPRPFYIIERFEPSVETIMLSNKNNFLGVGTAGYLAMGCIKCLRLIHEMGIVHQNVQPANFGVRLSGIGLLQRKESELAERVVLTDFSMCAFYRTSKTKSRYTGVFRGNWKYSSPEALELKEQTSVDDVISVIYMFHEMCKGTLPWSEPAFVVNREDPATVTRMIELKRTLETEKDIKNQDTLIVNNVMSLYTVVRMADGFKKQVDYEKLMETFLKIMEGGRDEQSLFGFQHPLFSAYRHGFEARDGASALPNGVGTEKEENMKGRGDAILGGKRTRDTTNKKSTHQSAVEKTKTDNKSSHQSNNSKKEKKNK